MSRRWIQRERSCRSCRGGEGFRATEPFLFLRGRCVEGERFLMAERKTKGAGRFENPLMPDERLRQMYTAMAQMRMLEEYLSGHGGRKEAKGAGLKIRGEEAARASTALSLGAGDLLSDCTEAPGMELLLGAKLGDLKRRVSASSRKGAVVDVAERYARRIPPVEDAGEQMQIALGAAAALKAQRAGRVLLVYVRPGRAKLKRWEKTLSVAGRRELPVIFVVLPEQRGGRFAAEGELSGRARGWGVPGFPVDGSDAIALYRVMQESLLRGRADGGPALIECIAFRLQEKGRTRVEDPLDRLRGLLLAKGVADERWMERTSSDFARRVGGSARRARPSGG